MPEIKNTFIKSKMNKDLDSRLVPNGEYRDAQNVSVSRSEGSDVGSLENILGNSVLTDLKNKIQTLEEEKLDAFYTELRLPSNSVKLDQLEIIGYYSALPQNTIYLFLTDYRDSSNSMLGNFANSDSVDTSSIPNQFIYKGAGCYIASYNLTTSISTILVAGNFLNFSKTHPIHGINLLEDLLFFTDNRNQPRKINVEKASINSSQNGSWESWDGSSSTQTYYYNEDDVSVAKFAPYDSFRFIDENNNSTLISNNEEFLPAHIATVPANTEAATSNRFQIVGNYNLTSGSEDIKSGDKVVVIIDEDNFEYTVSSALTAGANTRVNLTEAFNARSGFPSGGLLTTHIVLIQRLSPEYDDNYKGDINLLQDKFAKFSYRFKYNDDEYSLMAPFSQAAFVPFQFGYFINDDETIAAEATDVKFMENRVDQVKLNVTLPYNGDEMSKKLKVKELQILIKNSDETAVRVIEDVDVSRLGNTTNYEYDYLSIKPIKTLPEADLTRVHDKIPIRAMSQEVVGNRVVYGNFLDKHSSPNSLNYDLTYVDKSVSGSGSEVSIELPCHTLKQNRTYQVGIVLVDRYGRSSNVILNNPDNLGTGKNSTIYAPYVDFNNPALSTFFGKTLELAVRSEIPNTDPKPNYPGLYSSTNPLGYYTYRIVVKQQEQDYYNVYTPGALAGEILWDVASDSGSQSADREDQLPQYVTTNRISMLSFFGDNINKVPRELKTSTNANDTTYGSETVLFNRVNPIYNTSSYNKQSNVSKQGETVVSIEPFKDLGAWTTTKGQLYPNGNSASNAEPQPWYPYYKPTATQFNFHDVFFNAPANPFIATIETDFKIGATPVYLPDPATPAEKKLGIERAWQDLGVFETRPTKSVLDIYWESSTSGLVTDYNADATDATPVGVLDTAGNKTVEGQSIQYLQTENMPIGSNATTTLELTDANGGAITSSFNVTIASVIAGNGRRDSEFTITQPLNNNFIIQTADTQVFLANANFLENYTFNLEVESTESTPVWTGKQPIQITNCQLQNIAPIFDVQPISFKSVNISQAIQQADVFNIVTGTPSGDDVKVLNGSVNASENTKELIHEIVGETGYSQPNGGASDFRIEQNTTDPNKLTIVVKTDTGYWNTYPPYNGSYSATYRLQIKSTDANGAGKSTNSNTFVIVVNVQNA
jgi:hypothetical protein